MVEKCIIMKLYKFCMKINGKLLIYFYMDVCVICIIVYIDFNFI